MMTRLSEQWAVYASLVFVVVSKLLQYTASKHERWISQWSVFPQSRRLARKYQEVLLQRREIHKENQSISAQDNYAKWTKNNRKLTQLDTELDKLREQLSKSNALQKHYLKRMRLVGLTLPFLALKLWKGKVIVYELPTADTFPHVLAGILSQGWFYAGLIPLKILKGDYAALNKAHVGVSLGIWLWALQNVINTLEFLVKQLVMSVPVELPTTTDTVENMPVD